MIHILGAGNIGSLFAAALSRKSPVQFVMKPSTLKAYMNVSKGAITLHTPSIRGASWEAAIPATSSNDIKEPISKLLVAVKAHDVQTALSGIKQAITPETEIIVLHNGMGIKEKLIDLWPHPKLRPHLGFGVTNAGVRRHGPHWFFEYTGNGTCRFVAPSRNSSLGSLLSESSELVVSEEVPPSVFEHEQKRKLAVNSVINPLTAILQCPNGALLSIDGKQGQGHLMRRVLNESCKILNLDNDIMWDILVDVIARTSSNLSSMLSDIERGRTSEIGFINGYIVEEAQRQQMRSPLNLMLRDLVNMKLLQTRHELQSVLPLELEPRVD